MNDKRRTIPENKSLHKYLDDLANTLNNAGYDMKKTLRHDVEIPWTQESAKNHLWRPIQIAMLNIESTADMQRGDYSKVYEALNRYTQERLGISVEWPCKENLKSYKESFDQYRESRV